MIQSVADNQVKIKDKAQDASDSIKNTTKTSDIPPFKIDSYIRKPMKDIAKEFDQKYDWNEDHQINTKKDGYTVIF